MDFEGWGAQRWAIHLTKLLNAANPPDRYRFDIGALALETSRTFYPADPITRVVADELDGFEGALVPSESGKRWGIIHQKSQSRGRRRFTVAHEFGHYLLHRQKYPNGIHSSEAGVAGRTKQEVEREANDFASTLLMPFDDFRKQIPAKDKPDFDALSRSADRYDVSLAAAARQNAAARTGPMPSTSRSRSDVASMMSNTLLPKARTNFLAYTGPTPRIMPDDKYFSMPSAELGSEVRRNRALNCWTWVRSFIHSPVAVIHSPAAIVAACPTSVTKSRWPRALARRTQKPFSEL